MFQDVDQNAVHRKKDHIALAFQSQVAAMQLDSRFNYEPLLSGHPQTTDFPEFSFLGKKMKQRIWISSMTGGTEWAAKINHNLAKAAGIYGFGMGLGSCRSLLTEDTHLADFKVRDLMGDNLPLYANLGVAQVDRLIDTNQLYLVSNLLNKLSADGLMVHVNPMQEWLQPEGDRLTRSSLEIISRLIDKLPELKIVVKEVGQGMGPKSLEALFQLPLQGIEFAAAGGTSFSLLELHRSDVMQKEVFEPLASIGHSAEEMVCFVNQILQHNQELNIKDIIISGGVKNYLDGYYLLSKLNANAVYGQASAFLQYAQKDFDSLCEFIELQIQGYQIASTFFTLKI